MRHRWLGPLFVLLFCLMLALLFMHAVHDGHDVGTALGRVLSRLDDHVRPDRADPAQLAGHPAIGHCADGASSARRTISDDCVSAALHFPVARLRSDSDGRAPLGARRVLVVRTGGRMSFSQSRGETRKQVTSLDYRFPRSGSSACWLPSSRRLERTRTRRSTRSVRRRRRSSSRCSSSTKRSVTPRSGGTAPTTSSVRSARS